MKKNQTVQGTFSKLFGKKHANPTSNSLYATNPPWIFTQEAPEAATRNFDGIYYGENRSDTVSEPGTATLKARPRVRPLLTFLPLNAQESHGLAVPTPSVPEDFVDKDVKGTTSLVNGNLRLYSSVGDLRPGHYDQDPHIPPPPPGPAPGPPSEFLQPRGESPLPPPPPTAPPPPPLLLEPPPPPPPTTAPPPPPVLAALSPPSTPTPPDFIPPAPPVASSAPPPPPMPAPTPPVPVSSHMQSRPHLFPLGGVTKWKSEVTLNGRQSLTPKTSPPRSPAEPRGTLLGPKPEPHLTFPRSFKVPPPTPVRTSSIQTQEAQETPREEDEGTKKAPSRLPLPLSFHIRPASQLYPDPEPKPGGLGEVRPAEPASPGRGQTQTHTDESPETPPEAPPLPPPAPPLPPPAPLLPPAAPPLPSAEKTSPPLAGFTKGSKSSTSAPKPKPPSPDDTASSAPIDWRDPSQMDRLRSELAAYLCGSRREDRALSHKPNPVIAPQKEAKKGTSLLEKEAPPSLPEKQVPTNMPNKEASPNIPEKKSPHTSSPPEKDATANLTLPPVDYVPQDYPTPSVQQIRKELEARLSSLTEKEANPSSGPLPAKPLPEGSRIFENGAGNGKFSKPVTKNLPPVSITPLPIKPFQPKSTSGPAIPPKPTPGSITPPKPTPGSITPPKASTEPATPPKATPEPATPPKTTPGSVTPPKATSGPVTVTSCPAASSQLTPEKGPVPGYKEDPVEAQEPAMPSQPETKCPLSEDTKLPTQRVPSSPALPPKTTPVQEEAPYLYKPHCSQNGTREINAVMPSLARGEASGSGEPAVVTDPQVLPAKTSVPARSADEPLRHPVTGEVVERGSPMALLLAARQRAQKGRPGGAAPGRSSLPGSLRVHTSHPEAGSGSIIYHEKQLNSFTVVPKPSRELRKDPQPTVPGQWRPQACRDAEGAESRRWHKWTKAEPQAPAAWDTAAPCTPPHGRQLSKSSPASPSHQADEEFSFEVIPPPPEFSNDPDPPAPSLQYPGRRGSPTRNNLSDLGPPLDAGSATPARAPGFSRFSGAGGLERFSAGGRSLIKKRLYVGEPHPNPGLPRAGPSRSLSSPNSFGPQPGGPFGASGGPDMRRVNSVGRALPGGLQTRRMSLEGSRGTYTGDAKYKPPGGDYRSPHSRPHYGSPVNTFTVRPGTRHPISYAYSGAHRKAAS